MGSVEGLMGEPDLVVDLFCGAGGWDVGARALGLDPIGVELDADACASNAAAGGRVIRADVTRFPLEQLAGKVAGLIASPPCTDFSAAGLRAGIDGEHGRLMWEVPRWVEALRPRWVACEQVPPALEWWERFAFGFKQLGYKTWTGVLNAADYGVPQTRRRAFLLASLDGQPRPPAATHDRCPMPALFGDELLPWVSMAEALGWGMTERPCTTLMCGKNGGGPDPLSGGSGSRATQAAARESGAWKVGFPRKDDIGDSEDGYRERDWRQADEPAFALTEKARSWQVQFPGGGSERMTIRQAEEPAATLAFGHDAAGFVVTGVNTGRNWKAGGSREDAQVVPVSEHAPVVDATGRWHALVEQEPWVLARPATTVQGVDRVWPPGHKINGDDVRRLGQEEADRRYGHRNTSTAIRLTVEHALILQSFPPDFPLRGTRTSMFTQCGNAVPPTLAEHVLHAVLEAR